MDWTETFPPWITFAVVALAGVMVVLVLAALLWRRVGDSFPFTLQPSVLAPEENALRDALQQAVGDRALLLAKPRVADVLSVRKGLPKRRAAAAHERIASRVFDFVLCAPQDTRPLVAVELERPQGSTRRRRHDRFLDEACHAAGLGLLRIPAGESYAAAELREQIRPYIERSEAFRTGDVTPDGRREPILDLPFDEPRSSGNHA